MMRRIVWMVVPAGVAGLILAGCGKSEPPPASPAPAKATVEAPPAPAGAEAPAVSPAPAGPAAQPAPKSSPTSLLQEAQKLLPSSLSNQVTTAAPPAKAGAAVVAPVSLGALSTGEVTDGLKQALAKGVEQAINELGRENGFLKNLDVKIPMPESLKQVEKGLRALKQDAIADQFVATMNHAAEKAVPEAATVFGDAIRAMTIEDAKTILTGADDAATQYFRRTSEARLKEKFLPIVRQATQAVGVTAAYKDLLQKAGPAAAFLGKDAGDLDTYITQKSLEGLFRVIAAEEKQIRQNPVARTTDLLQKVFGSIGLTAK